MLGGSTGPDESVARTGAPAAEPAGNGEFSAADRAAPATSPTRRAAGDDASQAAPVHSGIDVTVLCAGGGVAVEVAVIGERQYRTLSTDEAGRARIDVAPGAYDVSFLRADRGRFVPAGDASTASVVVEPGARAAVDLRVALAATLSLRVPEGQSIPRSDSTFRLMVLEGGTWRDIGVQPRVQEPLATWSGLDPGHYWFEAKFGARPSDEVHLASGEHRILDIDTGLRPLALNLTVVSEPGGDPLDVPLAAVIWRQADGETMRRARTRTFARFPTTVHVEPGTYDVHLDGSVSSARRFASVRIRRESQRIEGIPVGDAGGRAAAEVLLDAPDGIAVIDVVVDDRRPKASRTLARIHLPGRSDSWTIGPWNAVQVHLDVAALRGRPVEIRTGQGHETRVLWSEIATAGAATWNVVVGP